MTGQQEERAVIGPGRTAYPNGTVIHGYTITFLALGGMSVVYRGVKDGKVYALKEVPETNTKEVPALISEKNLLERLDHPGVLDYETFFNERGYYYLVTELVEGRPLSDFLKSGEPNSPATVVDWGLQLCHIFHYLHQQNPPVIYRDLKSENILLHDDNQLKLIDFGIARIHKGSRQKDTELMGSPVTASPEHYGGAETDERSDIYTLGATLYELLTGGRRLQVGAFQFAPVRELRPDVSPELEAVLARALEFDPEKRYQNAIEFHQALADTLSETSSLPASIALPRIAAETTNMLPSSERTLVSKLLALSLLFVLFTAIGAGASHFGLLDRFTGAMSVPANSHEASLEGNLFAVGDVDGRAVVFMGEDLGLMEVTGWEEQSAGQRAGTLAKRLNTFYHSPCLECGKSALEPEDIKIGRYKDTKDTVVFYCHMHGSEIIHWGPDLLVTVTPEQAESLGVAPRFLAAHWRDLIRDTVNMSRGYPLENSALGSELANAVAKARQSLAPEQSDVSNLRRILREVSGKEALKLRKAFLKVGDRKVESDNFEGIKGYEQLRI